MKIYLVASLLALSGCTTQNTFLGPPDFQTWMRRALADPNSNEAFKRFSLAYKGESAALHAYFTMTLVQAESSENNVEAGEALSFELPTILLHVGDSRFASALAHEPERVQSAVACFLVVSSDHPQTKKLIDSAPKIDFPMLKTYRGNDSNEHKEA
jgi:hypothetical protein